jgi:hypothetical protein
MAEIRLRNVDEGVRATLKDQARRKGMTLSAYLYEVLRDHAAKPQREFAEQARKRLVEIQQKYSTFSDSAVLIREDRDARG